MESPDTLKTLTTYFQNHRYRDFYNLSHHVYGNILSWSDPKLVAMGLETLSQVGLSRLANSIVLRMYRMGMGHPQLDAHYIATIHQRRGSLKAWNAYKKLTGIKAQSEKSQAYLLCEYANILIQYRDFSAAEEVLTQAANIHTDRWVELVTIYNLYYQDKYNEALISTNRLLERESNYRPAIQLKANLLELKGQTAESIGLLKPIWYQAQSLSVGSQLFNLLVEQKHFSDAESCLKKIKELPPFLSKTTKSQLDNMTADLLCSQSKYEEALPYLDKDSFFHTAVSKSISAGTKEGQRKVLNVPFIRQKHMTCAPASLTAVSLYWGIAADQETIIDEICYNGTHDMDERKWAIEREWHTREFDVNCTSIKTLIDLEIPVLLTTKDPGSGHLQVIVGYDTRMGVYLLRDPYHPRLQEMLISGCKKYYASNGPRGMIIVPECVAHKLKGIELPSDWFYDKNYELNRNLLQHERDNAEEIITQMSNKDDTHRITIQCQRTLAFYNQDEQSVLEYTNQLLERYPNDVNLQISKSCSLSNMGFIKENLHYLETLNEKFDCDFLIKLRLVDSLRFDHRNLIRVEKLLTQLLSQRPLNAESLYAYAGVLWDKGEFEKSFQIYRFVTCIEDTNEQYAESYFKAARYHKKTQTALEFLEDRFQRLGEKSCGPALSLYNALDTLERTEEGFTHLQSALKLRPDDGHLKLCVAEKLIYINRIFDAEKLLQKAEGNANKVRILLIKAEVLERKIKYDEAIKHLKQVLILEPQNQSAIEATIRLIKNTGENKIAFDFVNQQLKKFPKNYNFHRLKIDLYNEYQQDEKEQALLELFEHHPDDWWVPYTLAYHYMEINKTTEALKWANEAVMIRHNNPETLLCLGDSLLADKQIEKAQEVFRKCIILSCDCNGVFQKLLQSSHNVNSQEKDIRLIQNELINQITHGNGLLEYQDIAWKWLPFEELIDFFQKAQQEREDLWQSWLALALEHRRQGNLSLSENVFSAAINRYPLIPRLHAERGETYKIMRQPEKAETDLVQALMLSPGWSTPTNTLSELLEHQGRIDEAVIYLEKNIKNYPRSISPYGYLADLCWRHNRGEKAIALLRKAIDIEPTYYWAWSKLFEWISTQPTKDILLEKLMEVRKSFPANGHFIQVQANIPENSQQSINLLTEFLQSYPHNISVCDELIQHLYKAGKIELALSYCSNEYWNDNPPVDIINTKAWIFAKVGDIKKGIKTLESLVENNENHYDTWRLLTIWYTETKNYELLKTSAEQCIRIYPDNPSVLCFVAEKFQELEIDKDRSYQLLKRAYELDPTDQYIGLTFIDHAITVGEIGEARKYLSTLNIYTNNVFTLYRELLIAAKTSNKVLCLDIWKNILCATPNDNWVVESAWGQLVELKIAGKACEIIEFLLAENHSIPAETGQFLAFYQYNIMGKNKFEKKLLSFTVVTEFDQRYIEGYIRRLIDNSEKISSKIIHHLYDSIQHDINNWGLVGYLYCNLQLWKKALNWMEGAEKREAIEPWMLYLYSASLRQNGHWENAILATTTAFQLPPDEYREDILVWHSLDLMLQNKPPPSGELDLIHPDNLAALNKYIYSLVFVLWTLKGRTFSEAYTEISPHLRNCQREFQGCEGSDAAKGAKQRVFKYLQNSINFPLLKSLLWKWKLYNNF